MKRRIAISAVIENNNATVTIYRQDGNTAKAVETHHATIHPECIEVANEFDVPLSTQILISKVIRAVIDDKSFDTQKES